MEGKEFTTEAALSSVMRATKMAKFLITDIDSRDGRGFSNSVPQ